MIVWPDADEPRLMSLVPLIHIALVDADTVADALRRHHPAEVVGRPADQRAADHRPSKTADIQQTPGLRRTGPKELVCCCSPGRTHNEHPSRPVRPRREFKRRAAEVVANPFLKKSFRGRWI